MQDAGTPARRAWIQAEQAQAARRNVGVTTPHGPRAARLSCERDRVVLWFEDAHACRCHRMAHHFVNLAGRTYCVSCEPTGGGTSGE